MIVVSLIDVPKENIRSGDSFNFPEVVYGGGDVVVKGSAGSVTLYGNNKQFIVVNENSSGYIEMEESYRNAISECGGSRSIFNNRMSMTVREMMETLGPNGVRFVVHPKSIKVDREIDLYEGNRG